MELPDRADLCVVAAQVHVELVIPRELPAAPLAVHHMHHGDVTNLHRAPAPLPIMFCMMFEWLSEFTHAPHAVLQPRTCIILHPEQA